MNICIEKVINNNIVSSRNQLGQEIIVMGRGLGFQKRKGDFLEHSRVEKIFRIESQVSMEKYKELVADMPWEYISAANRIIAFANETLNVQLNHNIYLTLTDHISFVITRYKEGMFFSNALYAEVKRFYPEEFHIAKTALKFIEETTGIRLPNEEAASIAIHLINAEFNIKVRDSFRLTNVLQDIVAILEREKYMPERDSLECDQLLSNLKFMVHRMLLLVPKETQQDPTFQELITTQCESEYTVVGQVAQYVRDKYECEMTEQEKIFFTVILKIGKVDKSKPL